MNALREWTDTVCGELNVAAGEVDRDLILDLARDVAHTVARPAAPLTAYIAGLAVGRGADGRVVAETIARLAEEWDGTTESGPSAAPKAQRDR